MRVLLKSVVEEGSGRNGAVEGYSVGGKTQRPRHFQEVQINIFLPL